MPRFPPSIAFNLKVVSPSAVVYWGNHGLLEGNWSTPGGGANTVDTVENVFVNNPELIHFSYERYLANRLREAFGFEGTPLRLKYKRKSKKRGEEPEKA